MPDFSGSEMTFFLLCPSAIVLCLLYRMPDMNNCLSVEVTLIFSLNLYFYMLKPH